FAEQTLYKLWDIEPGTRRCHVLAHIISSTATRQNPEKWREYLETVDYRSCGVGFPHGVMEAHIGDDPSFEINSDSINQFCSSKDYHRKQSCVHYFGHLLMIQSEGDIDPALDHCNGVESGLVEGDLAKRCYTGVFMEDGIPLALVEHGIRPKMPDRHSPEYIKEREKVCSNFKGDRAVACWQSLGENYKVFYNNPQKVYDACFKAPNQEQGTICFFNAAILFAIDPEYLGPNKLTNVCKPAMDTNLYQKCTRNMLSGLVYSSLKFTERGLLLCQNIPKNRDWCVEQLGKLLSEAVADPKERLSLCQSAESEKYKKLCARVN
ncbi:MAG: hypothetical protein Q8Q92_02145, partial [bacterium]|nr:hypothetical protein [bacterium]